VPGATASLVGKTTEPSLAGGDAGVVTGADEGAGAFVGAGDAVFGNGSCEGADGAVCSTV